MNINAAITAVVNELISDPNVKTATKYLSEKLTVKATRRHPTFKHAEEMVITQNRPNYAERLFIKACKKAGEPFPVKKVQLKFYPVKRKAA